MRRTCGLLIVLALPLVFCAQGQSPATATEIADKAKQADDFWQASNTASALPLYEELARQQPNKPEYVERLAFCLLSKALNSQSPDDKEALYQRAIAEIRRAQSLGDQSNLLQRMLEQIPRGPLPDLAGEMKDAEAAFSQGNLDSALKHYQTAAEADPKSYEARLFAGDMYFRKKDVEHAGEWFAKAIAVDPNRETAYRYWGDALTGAGQMERARDKFIDAVVAEPYQRKSWMGLQQWSQRAKVALRPPAVSRPKEGETPGPLWMPYQATRDRWRDKLFAQTHPMEAQYRHSLEEEVDALNAVIHAVNDQKITADNLDPGLCDLMNMADAHMIEAYVLISAADQGIAQDFAVYRDTHRDQLHAYIAKFIVRVAETH